MQDCYWVQLRCRVVDVVDGENEGIRRFKIGEKGREVLVLLRWTNDVGVGSVGRCDENTTRP